MWYHAIAYYGGTKRRYWWNRSKEDIIEDVLLPFVAKQVRKTTRKGVYSLFNFGSAQYITLLKTDAKLKRSARGKTPPELSNESFIKQNCATEEFVNELVILKSSSIARSMLEYALIEPENKIFVIMKFGDEILDSAYEGVIKPIGEEFGYRVIRVDEIQDSGNITNQILENISSSKIIIADLSGERPNCYYEAGFAHALGRELIFSIRHGEKIHFDLQAYRFIEWRTEADFRKKLRDRIEAITEKKNN